MPARFEYTLSWSKTMQLSAQYWIKLHIAIASANVGRPPQATKATK
jgi:hypothetical protein